MRLWSKMVDAKVMHNFYVPIKWEICVESLSFIHPLAVLNLSHALKERCLRKDGTISRICPTCLPIHQIHYTTSTREPPWYSTSPLSPMVTPWILDSILTAIMGSIIEFIQLPSLYEICTLKVYPSIYLRPRSTINASRRFISDSTGGNERPSQVPLQQLHKYNHNQVIVDSMGEIIMWRW